MRIMIRCSLQRLLRKLQGKEPVAPAPEPPKAEDRASDTASYAADQPIRSRAEDRFNRWPFASRIADTLARRADPSSLVVGVYGVWGDGKTSVLRLMEEALEEPPNVVVVKFNPWHFDSEAQLLRGFFQTLADAVGSSLPTNIERIGELLEEYGAVVSVLSGGTVGGLREAGEALSAVKLEDLRERIEKILREAGKRVVVLIDDIDRLDRREIQALFKLVKLSAGFERTSYVLAFDEEMVAAALGEKYG